MDTQQVHKPSSTSVTLPQNSMKVANDILSELIQNVTSKECHSVHLENLKWINQITLKSLHNALGEVKLQLKLILSLKIVIMQ